LFQMASQRQKAHGQSWCSDCVKACWTTLWRTWPKGAQRVQSGAGSYSGSYLSSKSVSQQRMQSTGEKARVRASWDVKEDPTKVWNVGGGPGMIVIKDASQIGGLSTKIANGWRPNGPSIQDLALKAIEEDRTGFRGEQKTISESNNNLLHPGHLGHSSGAQSRTVPTSPPIQAVPTGVVDEEDENLVVVEAVGDHDTRVQVV